MFFKNDVQIEISDEFQYLQLGEDLYPSVTAFLRDVFSINFRKDLINKPFAWSGYFDTYSLMRCNMYIQATRTSFCDIKFI